MLFSRRLFSQWMQLWHFKLVWLKAHGRFEGNLRLQVPGKVVAECGLIVWDDHVFRKPGVIAFEARKCNFIMKNTFPDIVEFYVNSSVSSEQRRVVFTERYAWHAEVPKMLIFVKRNRESTEGYSRWKVAKRHVKFWKTGLNNWIISIIFCKFMS